jgi:hypothetical protein
MLPKLSMKVLLPGDPAGKTMGADTIPLFLLLVWLLRSSWHSTRSVTLKKPGSGWFFKHAEEMSSSTSPASILRTCAHRAVSALPMLRGKNSKNTGGRPGWQKESSNSINSPSSSNSRTSSTSIQTGSSCNPSRSDSSSSSASSSKGSCKSISQATWSVTTALPAASIAAPQATATAAPPVTAKKVLFATPAPSSRSPACKQAYGLGSQCRPN